MKFTNKQNLPLALVKAVENDHYQNTSDVSCTALIGPPRMYWLKKRNKDNITVDVADMIWMLFGTAFHSIMEKNADENTFTEERLEIEVNGWTLGGSPDEMSETKITDYKTAQAYTVIKDKHKQDYVTQLNIYKHIASKHGFDIKELENLYFIKDWSKAKAKRDSSYPQQAVLAVKQPIMENMGDYIEKRVKLFQDSEKGELPQCTPEERWTRPTVFALMKKGRVSAIKLCDTSDEAYELLEKKYKGADEVVKRLGEDVRCASYCDVCEFCDYYKDMVEGNNGNYVCRCR